MHAVCHKTAVQLYSKELNHEGDEVSGKISLLPNSQLISNPKSDINIKCEVMRKKDEVIGLKKKMR